MIKDKKTQDRPKGLEAPMKMKILITIVERGKAEFFLDYLETFKINLHALFYAEGTATSELMSFTGLHDKDKAVILSIVGEEIIDEIKLGLLEKFTKVKGGKGLAFTIPISSVIGVMVYRFLSNMKE